MKKFVNKYTNYLCKYLIGEGTVKSLIPILQSTLLSDMYNNYTYQDLPENLKSDFQRQLNVDINFFKERVESVTTNKQYQSWLYDVIVKNWDTFNWKNDEFKFIKFIINKFSHIVKSNLVSKEQRNIINYNSITDLAEFVHNFEDEHPNYIKPEFKHIYSNNSYSIYKIEKENKDQFQQMYGDNGFKCAWCVADENSSYFDSYLKTNDDCYYLWTYKGNYKPFALLHFGSWQFKDIHNEAMMDYDKECMDGVNKCAEYHGCDWANCKTRNDFDLFNYKWMIAYQTGKIGELICTNDELAIYKDVNKLSGFDDAYILTNGTEDVVGSFQLDGSYAEGCMSDLIVLCLLTQCRPTVFIDACKKEGKVFSNLLIINKGKQLPNFKHNVVAFMTASWCELLSQCGDYRCYGSKKSNNDNQYLIYNYKNDTYDAEIELISLPTYNKKLDKRTNTLVIQVGFVTGFSPKGEQNISTDIIDKIVDDLAKIEPKFKEAKYLIDNRHY